MQTHLHRILTTLSLVAALGLLAGCGKKPGHGDHDHEHGHDHHGKHGGALIESEDHKVHFEMVHHADEKKVTLYIYDGEMSYRGIGEPPVLNLVGKSGSEKVTGVMGAKEGELAAAEWHFTNELLAGEPEGRFRVKIGSKTYMPKTAYGDDHGHHHEGVGPHDGMVAHLEDGKGFIELKLHDDKGDLELWIARDENIEKAMDLPLTTTITVTFTEPKATTVTLAARNQDKNEDEDGVANNRGGKTNYFIFPGDTGADAAWLMGEDFKGKVIVSFQDGDKTYTSEAFELIPHTHTDGDHDHD